MPLCNSGAVAMAKQQEWSCDKLHTHGMRGVCSVRVCIESFSSACARWEALGNLRSRQPSYLLSFAGHAVVFDDKGRFYQCDLKNGHLSPRPNRDLALWTALDSTQDQSHTDLRFQEARHGSKNVPSNSGFTFFLTGGMLQMSWVCGSRRDDAAPFLIFNLITLITGRILQRGYQRRLLRSSSAIS